MSSRSDETRKRILTSAEAEFSEMGFYGARMDIIAEKAGVNKALLYRYFGSKEELYKTVFFLVYDRFSVCENEILTNPSDNRSKIRSFVAMEFEYCKNNPSYVRMIMWENLNYGKCFNERTLHESKNPILQRLEDIVNKAHEEGTLRKNVDAKQLLLTLYGCCFSYFTNTYTLSQIMAYDMLDDKEIENRIEVVTDMLMKYIYGEEK